jgi:hypothetical protein
MEYLNNVLPYIHAEADPNNNEGEPAKPQLTDEEKKKFNEVFRERYAELQEKSRKDLAKALEEQTKKLEEKFAAEIEKAKAPKSKDGNGEDDNAEAKRIVADLKKSKETLEQQLLSWTETVKKKDSEIYSMRKDAAITDAISGIPFVNLKQVKVLTGDAIELDPDTQKFVIRNEDGDIIQGDDFKPLSLKAYFAQYAEQNPHMVRSDVKGGAGSTPNAAPGAPGEFAHIKSKADLAGPHNMQLRIRYVDKFPGKYETLPLK